jgi:gamma-glutamylcyclotransferase (GGCT)/AIG2-like uncharacterized protein YtfP
MNKHLVFVYGTLGRGNPGSMSVRFPNSKFVGETRLSGKLYDLGPYPGAILDGSNSFVSGEVYEVYDEVLDQLDDFEANSNYRRKQVKLSLDSELAAGWVYEPDPEFYSLTKLIPSGDWIEYSLARAD